MRYNECPDGMIPQSWDLGEALDGLPIDEAIVKLSEIRNLALASGYLLGSLHVEWVDEWDGPHAFELWGRRPETSEERENHLMYTRRVAAEKERAERAEFARLQAKYGKE